MVRVDSRFFGSARSFSDIVHLGSSGESASFSVGLNTTSASVLELCESAISQMTKSNQICFRGVRSSKFRHVYGCVGKREKCYEGLTITKNAHDSHFCAVNPKFLAVVTEVAGGGCFAVVPIHETGRVDLVVGRVTGHTGPVLDIKWNPFNDNVIASCSDDCTVKLWHIPDGGIRGKGGSATLDEWLVDLHGHTRRVGHIEWHPTADGVLVSAGFDRLLIIWNIAQGDAIRVLDLHTDSIYSLSFNRDGSRLATTCKDKKLRIIDPRTGKLIQEGRCHEGSKASKVVYLGQSGRLATTGFSRYSDRQLAIWQDDDLANPLRIEDIDSSSGVIFPIYDADTRILYLAGKGDGNIRYYEMVDSDPWWFYLNQYLSGYPQRGLGIMPKRGVDPAVCEIMRFYKLHASRGLVEPISMIVPRKSDSSCFHDDLYPDTPGPTATLTAAEWLDGKNAAPLLISLKSGWKMPTNKPVVYKPSEKKLITSDLNNERKFLFISQETHPDYRSLDCRKTANSTTMTSPEPTAVSLTTVSAYTTSSPTSISTSTATAAITLKMNGESADGKKAPTPAARTNGRGSTSPPAVVPRRRSAVGSDAKTVVANGSPHSPPSSVRQSSAKMSKDMNGFPLHQVRRRSTGTGGFAASDLSAASSRSSSIAVPDSGTSTATPTSTSTSEQEEEDDDNDKVTGDRRSGRVVRDVRRDDDDDGDGDDDSSSNSSNGDVGGSKRSSSSKFRLISQSLEDVRKGSVGPSLPPRPRMARSQSVMWRRRSGPKGRLISELIAALQKQASFSASSSTDAEDSSQPNGGLTRVNSGCDRAPVRPFRRSSLCRSEPHLPFGLGVERAQEQELVQSGGMSLSELNAHGQMQQDKQGGVLSPGVSRFHEIQKIWGDRTGSMPASKKGGDTMSMSVDSIPKEHAGGEEVQHKVNKEMKMNGDADADVKEESSCAELKSEIRCLKSQLTEKDAKIRGLQNEVSDLKHQLMDVQSQLSDLRRISSTSSGGSADQSVPDYLMDDA